MLISLILTVNLIKNFFFCYFFHYKDQKFETHVETVVDILDLYNIPNDVAIDVHQVLVTKPTPKDVKNLTVDLYDFLIIAKQ